MQIMSSSVQDLVLIRPEVKAELFVTGFIIYGFLIWNAQKICNRNTLVYKVYPASLAKSCIPPWRLWVKSKDLCKYKKFIEFYSWNIRSRLIFSFYRGGNRFPEKSKCHRFVGNKQIWVASPDVLISLATHVW